MCVLTRPVLTYIIDNPDTWEEDFKEKHIKVKYKGNLAIFNYEMGADFNDIVVRDARGIIIDMKNFRIVCYPFNKFGNYYESYADEIDWETALVQEKIDGSIVKLYYYNGDWHWATNSCIDAADAIVNGTNISFEIIIKKAENFKNIDFDILDKTRTYIFELVSPETQVVIKYTMPYLYHIGTRSNLSGVEYNTNIGIEKPYVYPMYSHTLDDVLSEAEAMNADGIVRHEGFVVVDSNYNRIKVKNVEYIKMHHQVSVKVLTKKDALETLIFKDEERIYALEENNRLKAQLYFYKWQLSEFEYRLERYIDTVRNLYNYSFGKDRKRFALEIKNDQLAGFGFAAIDNMNLSALDLIKKTPINRLLPYIDDYNFA